MERLKFGVVVFPGSNCDHDAYYVLKEMYHQDVTFLWHKNSTLEDSDVIILPGGFSYGDYLRCGAIARFSPIMKEVVSFAGSGGTVLGICNGFQTLCEAGLLPGALLRNANLSFACKYVNLRVENNNSRFTSECLPGDVLEIPIAHGEGNYYADDKTLDMLEQNGRVLFRYCEPDGTLTASANPNGSSRNIAGIMNAAGNVMGMMPHPERAADPVLRHTDGQKILSSIIRTVVPAEVTHGVPFAERS
jgi:phosphoribosylformylglycinamidine synthase subunit PurQ / glutaminase